MQIEIISALSFKIFGIFCQVNPNKDTIPHKRPLRCSILFVPLELLGTEIDNCDTVLIWQREQCEHYKFIKISGKITGSVRQLAKATGNSLNRWSVCIRKKGEKKDWHDQTEVVSESV